jgi:hypothetical protein
MNNLKLLASSALFALTLGIPQDSWGMDPEPSTSHLLGTQLKFSAQVDQLDDSFKQSPFYHPLVIEQYRSSVQVLRQEIMELQKQIMPSKLDKKNKEDMGKTRQEIQKPSLDTSKKNHLEVKLKKLEEEFRVSEDAKNLKKQKFQEIKALYELYSGGLCPDDNFFKKLPSSVLESFGIPSIQLNNLDTERLFMLFARTMELPYVALQAGKEGEEEQEGEKKEAYARQVKVLIQNFTHRLKEDAFTIQLSSSITQGALFAHAMKAAEEKKDGEEGEASAQEVGASGAQGGKILLNFGEQGKNLEKLAANPQSLQALSEQTVNEGLAALKNILSTHGYQEQKPSSLLEAVIRQSPYGLLGLCIGALESHPITSWNDMGKMGLQARMRDVKNPEELSATIIENIYSILGRHINKQVLQKIEETLQPAAQELEEASDGDVDDYI